jgi:hypothetical protein
MRSLLAGLTIAVLGCSTTTKEQVVEKPVSPQVQVVTPAPAPTQVQVVTPAPATKVIVVPSN